MARLLIVEDNLSYADDVADYLAEGGHQVTVCATAGAMWTALNTGPADVILLDLGLPDACGMVLIPQLRSRFPDTGILVFTARAVLDSHIEALQSGAHDFLKKPIKFDVLSQHIEQVCKLVGKTTHDPLEEDGPHDPAFP